MLCFAGWCGGLTARSNKSQGRYDNCFDPEKQQIQNAAEALQRPRNDLQQMNSYFYNGDQSKDGAPGVQGERFREPENKVYMISPKESLDGNAEASAP